MWSWKSSITSYSVMSGLHRRLPCDSMEMELWTVGHRCHCPPAISVLLATHIFQTDGSLSFNVIK